MKPKYRSLHSLQLTAIALSLAGLSSQSSHAANRTWSGSSSSAWATSGNWSTLPVATDAAIFSGAGNGNTTIDLGVSGATIKSITFDTASAAAYTIGAGAAGSQTLTIGDAGIISLTSLVVQNQLINANVTLGTAISSTYNFSNSSTKSLTFAGSIQGGTGGTAGAKTLTLDGLGTTTVTGAISNGGSSSLAIVANSGLLTLSGSNSYTGGTSISGGVLQVSNIGNQGSTTSNLGTGTTLKIGTSTSTGTFRYTGGGEATNRIIDLSGATFGATLDASGAGLLKLTSDFTATGAGDKTLTLTGSGAGEIGGKIVDNSVANVTSLTKAGSNTWTLSGLNTYTGLTDVQAGTLAYGVSNAIASGAVQVSGGTLDLGTYSDTVGAVTMTSGTINGSSGALTGSSYAVQSGSVAAVLAGAGALTKTTAGTVTLSNANTYTGITTISAGVLSVSSLANGGTASGLGQSTNAAANLVLGGGTLQYTGATVATDRNFTFTGASNSSVEITNAGTNLTLGGASTASTGGLTKIGAGTLTLTGNNLYTGATTVTAGTLSLARNGGSLAASAVTVNGGTLDVAQSDAVGAVTLSSGTISGVGTLTGTSYALTDSGSVSAILAGAVNLTKTGAGTATLSAANTYSGITTLSAGVLSVATIGNGGVAGNLGQSTNAAANLVLGGGTLQYTGSTASTDRNFTLTASTASSVDVSNAGTNLTLGGASTNTTGGLNKIGAGQLTLTGANLHTGLTDVQAGTLAYGANNALSSGAVQVSGGILDLKTFSDTVGAVTLASGSITGSNGVLTGTSYALQSGSVSAILGGAGALNKTTAGIATLSGANTYTGLATVTAGTLRATTSANALGAGAASLTLAGGILELANDTGLNFARNTTLTADSTINSDVLSVGGAGVTHTLGTLTLTGQTLSIASGTNVGSGSAGITFGAVAVNGAAVTTTFNVDSGDLLTLGAVTPAGSGNKLIVFGGNGNTTVGGVLNDAGGASTASVTKSGSGTLTLTSANLYEAATTVSGGVLRAQNSTALGTIAGGVSVADGAALELDGAAGALTIGAEALTLNGTGVLGGGSLRNIAGNNSYAGVITLASASRINSDADILTINSAGSITGNFGLTFGGAGNIVLSDAFAPVTTAQTLTKDGAGKLTLNVANTHTGLTTVAAGTLEYGIANALSTGGLTVSGGTLDLKAFNDSVGAVTLSGGNINSTSGILTGTSYAVQSGSISAVLAGTSVALTKTTAGTVVLSGLNTYTGATNINSGILSVASLLNGGVASGIGQSTNVASNLVFGGGTLRYTGATASSDRAYTLTSSTTSTLDVATALANLTLSGASAAGSGALNKVGLGTLTLSGANQHTGLTDVQEGTLAYGANSVLLTGAVQVSGGTLDLKAFSDTVGAVTLVSGNINGTSGVLTGTSYGAQSGSITAILAGSGAFTKTTAGTVTLSGVNTYSGGTQLNDGVLALGSSAALGSTGSIGFGGGTLQYSSSNASDYSSRFSTAAGQAYKIDTNGRNVAFASGLLSAGGTLHKSGAGTLTINGISTYTGKTTVSAGTLAIGANGSIANSSEVSLSGGNFNVSAVTNYALGSTQSLTGSGSVTGDLSINGTLAIGASPGTIAFNNNLTLGLGSVSNFEFTSGGFGAGSFDLAQGGLAQTVNFGGILNLFFKADETFTHETSVKIFDFGSYTGNFTAVNVSGLTGDSSATFNSSTGIVTVVPEPTSAVLGGLGLLALLRRRR